MLAATGLLAGRKATTHWTYSDVFRERFPDVELDPNVLYVGGDRLFTSAGTAAGIDLCLHLVRGDWGAEVANVVARRMVVAPHRDGGQAQFVEVPVPTSDDADADLRAVLRWVEGNLDRDLNVYELARRAAMTTRTFARRFKQSTGTTPLQWVLHQRVAQGATAARDDPPRCRRDRRDVRLQLGRRAASTLRPPRRIDAERLSVQLQSGGLSAILEGCRGRSSAG